jgi:sulfoxide reductase heme-binding subunit YedZ
MATANTTTLATAVAPHLFWITSRAAGTAARLLKGRGVELRVTHEALSLAALATLLVHGLSLLGDGYMHPSLGDIAVPFLSGYKTFWTAAGIVAFWMLLALGLSYYARARIGQERWRRLHRFTALAWALGVVHSLGEGSDAGQAWFLVMTAIVVVPALALLVIRHARQIGRARSGSQPRHAEAGARSTAANTIGVT